MLNRLIVLIDMLWMSDYNAGSERIYDIVARDFDILDIVLDMDTIKSGKSDLTVQHLDIPRPVDHDRCRRYIIAPVEGLMPVYAAGEVSCVHDRALNGRITAGTGCYRTGSVAKSISARQFIQFVVGMGKLQPVEGYILTRPLSEP